jgi:hypothetical protein
MMNGIIWLAIKRRFSELYRVQNLPRFFNQIQRMKNKLGIAYKANHGKVHYKFLNKLQQVTHNHVI